MQCPACGVRNRPNARFCDQCGTRLDSPARARPADRRVVSAVFADLVGYVRMLAESDSEVVKQRVDAALAAMDVTIRHYGGRTEKFIGDAVFAVFGYPRIRDDDALRAAHCALEIRRALARLHVPGGPLEVRIGVATGEVVAVSDGEGAGPEVVLTGPAVVSAARLQDLARPNEVLADEATVRATRGRLRFEDRGNVLLRGQIDPMRLYRLPEQSGGQQPPGVGAGPLVGRGDERRRLRAALEVTATSGQGRVVVVAGDPGMGKSRLFADLEPAARAAGFAWTWTENVSYGRGEPFRFLRVFAQAVADEQGTDSGTLARQLLFTPNLPPEESTRIAGAIAAVARDAAFSGWEAEAPFAPTDPAEILAGVLEASVRYTRRMAEVFGPRVIVIDDVHWIDHSSVPMVEQLVRMAPRLPFLILFGIRAGTIPAWAQLPQVERLELAGLAADETKALARDLLGAELDPEGSRHLHERSDGNPLFIREIVRAALDEGTSGDGLPAVEERLVSGKVPLTLRGLLGARIDALADDEREFVQVASVIGMVFRLPHVARLLGTDPSREALSRLASDALVLPVERDVWRFGHSLIRDAAYESLLASRRRELHTRLADHLEGDPAAPIGRVATHRAAAGDVARAVPLLAEAAEASFTLGAFREAAGFWRLAADIAGPGGERDEFLDRERQALDAGPGRGPTTAG